MKIETKQKIFKLIISVAILLVICLAIYLPLKLTGALNKITNADDLKNIIKSGGIYSYLIFFTLQFIQVTFLPLPAFVTTAVGALIFGPWIAFIISLFAVLCGSMFAFFLGRKVGRPIINWIVGKETANKWEEKLSKGKYFFFLMMLFPFFPDDILCIVAGTTNISWKFFIITNLITRPINLLVICFVGSGQIIPYSGWGIPVWIVLIALMISAFIISIKYNEKIEKMLLKLCNKKEKDK